MGVILASCSNDDDGVRLLNDPIQDSIEYDLGEVSNSGVSGKATFNELESGVIQLVMIVNVHLSANDLGTIVAQGDIGANE